MIDCLKGEGNEFVIIVQYDQYLSVYSSLVSLMLLILSVDAKFIHC